MKKTKLGTEPNKEREERTMREEREREREREQKSTGASSQPSQDGDAAFKLRDCRGNKNQEREDGKEDKSL